MASNKHIKGTNYRLSKKTGINLDNKLVVTSQEESELKKQIDKFANENISESPNRKGKDVDTNTYHVYMLSSMKPQKWKWPFRCFVPIGLKMYSNQNQATMPCALVNSVRIRL